MIKKRTPRDYKFIRLLGEGSFSSVYLAVDANPNTEHLTTTTTTTTTAASENIDNNRPSTSVRKYAIKVCQKNYIKRQGKQVAIMREKDIMNMLNRAPNKHFIKLYCTFQDMERLYFVMSYAAHGDLLTCMQENPLPLGTVKSYTLQLVDALEHMHRLGIVHRDLKPENILLNEHNDIQISDFGSAQVYKTPLNSSGIPSEQQQQQQQQLTIPDLDAQGTPKLCTNGDATTRSIESANSSSSLMISRNAASVIERRNSFVGTAQYVSPEMLKCRQASNKSDLWALGIIIYQMHTNVMPFNAPNEYLVYQKIQNLDFEFTDGFDSDCRDLVEALIKLEPLERLGALDNVYTNGYTSIRQHIFLQSHMTDIEGHQEEAADSHREALNEHEQTVDADLIGIEDINPGLDEAQLLRLLTVG